MDKMSKNNKKENPVVTGWNKVAERYVPPKLNQEEKRLIKEALRIEIESKKAGFVLGGRVNL